MIAVARTFHVRPSSMIAGLSTYEAYCFDVACTIYVVELEKDNKPYANSEDATKWL